MEEFRNMDNRTSMTMHKALHPRDDIYRLYGSRKEGGRGLASTEDCVGVTVQRIKEQRTKRY